MTVLEIIISKSLQCPDIIFSVGILKCYVTEKSNSYVNYVVIGTITMPSKIFVIYRQSLALTLIAFHKFASSRMTYPTDVPLRRTGPRDWPVKSWKSKHPDNQLEPKWALPGSFNNPFFC